ncbi:MAG: T9SS C-terminal target domain-containing protein, partial [Chitinophagia bacterium]|nr:T9SS C-terminal target domain-containing protein [Chitinophagia bacterium]
KRAAVINQPIAFADKAYHTSYAHELIPLAVAENAAPLEINDVGRATFCNLSFSPSILCEGSTATFTAVATNGGSHPTFRFIVNGHTVQYGSSHTYATASLRLNDTVVCMMHSTDSCAAPDSIASNTILAPIWPTASPSVTITVSPGDTILAGTRVYFTATVTNGGPSPFYDWRKNGISTGFNRSTYTSTTLTNGDVVTCYVNTSVCAAPSFAISNADTIVIIDAGVTAIPLLANSLYPNPTTGNCTLTLPGAQSGQLVVTNVLGETFVNRPVSGTETIIYTGSWPTGSYLVRLRTATGSWYTSLQVMR